MSTSIRRSALISALATTLALFGCKSEDGQGDAGGDGPAASDAQVEPIKKGDLKRDLNTKPKPKITQLIPDNGFSTGGYTVTVVGENFAAGAAVYLDGQPQDVVVNVASSISLSFTMKANPYDPTKPGKVYVGVMVNQQFSNTMGFSYTISTPMTSAFKGSVLTASTSCFRDFPSDPIEGKVTLASDAGAPSIKAEVGYSAKVGSDPSKDSGWKWTAATFLKKDAAYDVYAAPLTVPLSTTYDIAYRFSADNGQTWIYADTDETDLKYDPAKAAKLTATDPPLYYCLSSADCTKYSYEVVCKIDTANKANNKCIECLADADCKGNPKALGPKCNTAKMLCGCAADGDCASNPNGAKCLGWCGCESDTNCVSPAKCYEDKSGITICK